MRPFLQTLSAEILKLKRTLALWIEHTSHLLGLSLALAAAISLIGGWMLVRRDVTS